MSGSGERDRPAVMIVAVAVLVVGFFSGAVITQLMGYRLGGTLTVPLVAVYTLTEFVTLPVFVLSAVAAAVGLTLLRRRTLIYGRDELVAAVLIGSLVPLTVLLLVEGSRPSSAVAFIGSVLPGLAAYNYLQVDPERRRADVLATGLLLAGLLALGWVLVRPSLVVGLGTLTPPVLYSPAADVALVKGAVVNTDLVPVVVPRAIAVALFAAGFAVSELLRAQYGVRTGIVVAVLVAVYALASVWLVVMYLVLSGVSFVFVHTLHYLTLRYGRVTLGLTAGVSTAAALLLVLGLPIERGLSAAIVGILGGVTGYNGHVTPPVDRRLVVPLQVTVFVPALFVGRLFTTPAPEGVPQRLSAGVLVGGGVLMLAAVLVAEYVTVDPPDKEAVPDVTEGEYS